MTHTYWFYQGAFLILRSRWICSRLAVGLGTRSFGLRLLVWHCCHIMTPQGEHCFFSPFVYLHLAPKPAFFYFVWLRVRSRFVRERREVIVTDSKHHVLLGELYFVGHFMLYSMQRLLSRSNTTLPRPCAMMGPVRVLGDP